MLDFNREYHATKPINISINERIERSVTLEANTRKYLGASAIGSECLRKIQFDWMVDPVHPARLRDIFARGHFFEQLTRNHLSKAGFKFSAPERLGFKALDGLFRGNADGILIAGPDLPGLGYPCLWEHKTLGAKSFRAVERDGLEGGYPQYAAQVAIYQAYLDVTEHPALFTVINADNCERLHFLVPFDAARAQRWSDHAVTVITATKAGELLERVTDNPEDWRCKMCGHRERCWSGEHEHK